MSHHPTFFFCNSVKSTEYHPCAFNGSIPFSLAKSSKNSLQFLMSCQLFFLTGARSERKGGKATNFGQLKETTDLHESSLFQERSP